MNQLPPLNNQSMEINYLNKSFKQQKKKDENNQKSSKTIVEKIEHINFKAMEEDKADYASAMKVKKKNKIWHSHKSVKKELNL
jgi:hypothetical protein